MTCHPALLVCAIATTTLVAAEDPSARFVRVEAGRLVYDQSLSGDRIIDFSHCGYGGGGVALPQVPGLFRVLPAEGDDTLRIQQALDAAAAAPLRADGYRGAVVLAPGQFEVQGALRLHGAGVVMRGAGTGANGTSIIGTSQSRRPLIRVGAASAANDDAATTPLPLAADAPAGALQITLVNTCGLSVGQSIEIRHPGTREWIAAIGMDQFPSDDGKGSWLDWKPDQINLTWTRSITAIQGDTLTLDAPLTSAIQLALSPATVVVRDESAASRNLGLEHLALVSDVHTDNPCDEDHAWDAVRIDQAVDVWVRNLACRQFAGSAVLVGDDARRVTVADCVSTEPVSEDAAWRRNTYFTTGQQTLFVRCEARSGRRDFAVGHLAAGPNAFVDCTAHAAARESGPCGSWACGTLYDNVAIDGAGLALTNRETAAQGTGWSAANCVLWNCVAPVITCRQPPTAQNWAIGVWGEFAGDGHWRQMNEFADPQSLYKAQLRDRVGTSAVDTALASITAPPSGDTQTPAFSPVATRRSTSTTADHTPSADARLQLTNGWLTVGDRLAVGRRLQPTWWRGSILPTRAAEFGPSLTRFVPGRDGLGATDDIREVADAMQSAGQVVLEHHWGLWYDRRRDDHQMVRRADGEVSPPFYELPWARSGEGRAWDGLSRYDLTQFNPWYFARLQEFAAEADARGLVLIQQMYFQHNILEAGAHWADFPWRPANCLQATGFPEPPPYVGGKRVFMAEAFYDVMHPVRRELHRAYIRHCLDVLGRHDNVLFLTGEEFTGPLSFVRFWLQTISEWEAEHGRQVLVGLSATKDVQDAVLADAELEPLVDVIDLKYWWYTADGGQFDPPGGANLAPRQQLREWRGGKNSSAAGIGRGIREYRLKFPRKAVICSLPGADPWVVAAAGGSLAELPRSADSRLLTEIPQLQPARETGDDAFILAAPAGPRMLVSARTSTESVAAPSISTVASWRTIDPQSGGLLEGAEAEVSPTERSETRWRVRWKPDA